MKPFYDKGALGNLSRQESGSDRKNPKKSGYGVELRTGRDVKKRKNQFFISSGKWAEMADDGVIDQQITQITFGQLIDPLDFIPFTDQSERINAPSVLASGEIIQGQTLDYEGETNKDGRITIFDIRARGYVINEEIPHKTRGIKVENSTIMGYSVGISKDPFLDGGESSLGIAREGFYGIPGSFTDTFEDTDQTNGLGFIIDSEDYSESYETGAHGNILYSSKFETDSIAFYGLLK